MKTEFNAVQIYIDSKNNLIIIPTALTSQRSIKEINLVNVLNSPYTDEQLEAALMKSMKQCHSIKPDESSDESIIEKHLGINGYTKAIKNLRFVSFSWIKDEGYLIGPSVKSRGGFTGFKRINLGNTLEKGQLAKAFKEALEESN
jgi:hypothetical protein